MDQFTPQNIAITLLVVGACWLAAQWFVRWCKRIDGRPAYDPLRDGPVDLKCEFSRFAMTTKEGELIIAAESVNGDVKLFRQHLGPVEITEDMVGQRISLHHLMPDSLRTPFPVYRNTEGAAQAGERQP